VTVETCTVSYLEALNTAGIHEKEKIMRKTKIILFAAIACAVISLAGCTALYTNYGGIVPNDEARHAFESYRVDPDLNYYFSGSSSIPNALMGLHKSYKLNSEFWRKIELTPDVLRDLVSNMQARAGDISTFQHGFAILDDKGQQIGIWYSLLDTRTFVKMEGEKTVIINTPPHDTYDKHEDGGKDKPIVD
jgi:hypothetical protein